jgi:hypothetical protein
MQSKTNTYLLLNDIRIKRNGEKMKNKFVLSFVLVLALALSLTGIASAKRTAADAPVLMTSGLQGASGSTVGPDGALYVPEGATGKITRIDPQTGAKTTYASGLPQALIPIGGATDIAFLDGKAYVLVTMVGSDMPVPGGNSTVGIYRVDSPTSFTVVADIGTYSITNPSGSIVFIPSGVHYALEPFNGGFLVTDGHHNRVLWASLNGDVSTFKQFGNIVPTGLEVRGHTVYMAEAGPNPHLPEVGKVMAIDARSLSVSEVASGAPLIVDVEFGLGNTLYALAQGEFPVGAGDGSPALPNTGSLVVVNADGTFSVLAQGLNQPTSMEFIGNTAYVITLGGEVWKIADVSSPPFGGTR